MNPVRVYIATTAGPVAIQRITEEDPDVNSVICLAGKAVALPVSGAYDAFVRNPTGIVQRHFKHNAYRIDVSEKIDEGYSWQLGVFAAHALHRAARLATPKDIAATVVIATGEVDRDLDILAVDGVAEKISQIEEIFPDIVSDAERVLIAVPPGSEAPWRHAFGNVEFSGAVEILGPANAAELLDKLGVPIAAPEASSAPAPPSAPDTSPAPPRRRGRILVLGAILALAAMAAAAGGVVYAPEIKSWVAEVTATEAEPERPIPMLKPDTQPATSPQGEPTASPSTPEPAEPTVPPLAESKPVPTPEPTPEPVPASKPAPIPASVPQAPPQPAPPAIAETDKIPSKRAPPRKPAVVKTQDSDRIEEARLPRARNSQVQVTIEELRAPPGQSCAAVRAGRVTPLRVLAPRRNAERFRLSPHKNLCTVEIKASSDDAGTYMFGRYQRWTQSRPVDSPPDKVIDLGPRRGDVRWTVDIPDRLRRGAVFRIVVFSAAREYTPSERILNRLNRIDPASDRMQRIFDRLQRRGIQVSYSQYRIIDERRLRDRRLPQQGFPPPPEGRFPRPSEDGFPPPRGGGFPPPPGGFPPPPRG